MCAVPSRVAANSIMTSPTQAIFRILLLLRGIKRS